MRETIENIIGLILLGMMAVVGMMVAAMVMLFAIIIDNFPIVLVCATAIIITGWLI